MSRENMKKYRKKGLSYPDSYQGEQHEAYVIAASQVIYDKILRVHFIPIKQQLKSCLKIQKPPARKNRAVSRHHPTPSPLIL